MKLNGLIKDFITDDSLPWENVGDRVQRKILAYDDRLMLVKVRFASGGIGTVHQHPHSQITFVESGVFEIELDGTKQTLKAGDAYYVAPGKLHGAVCIEDGMLIDAFSPNREDFLN